MTKQLTTATIIFCLVFFSFATDATTNPFVLLWGRTAPTEIVFAPFGYHLFDSSNKQYVFHQGSSGTVNDAQYLVEFHWNSIAVSTFTNSFRDQVECVGLYREIIYFERFKLAYLIGIMTGYGSHADENGGPSFTHSIVANDPGLIVALDAKIVLTKRISFHLIGPINLRTVIFGLGYTFS